jgi:ATP synthase protein I
LPFPSVPSDDDDFKARLRSLDRSLESLKADKREDPAKAKERSDGAKALSMCYRIMIEIVAGFLVGYFLGKTLDNMLETGTVFTIICLLLGISGAFWNIYKSMKQP